MLSFPPSNVPGPPSSPQYGALILDKLEEILAELKWMHRNDPRREIKK